MIDVAALSKRLGLPETAFETEETFQKAFDDPKTGYVARAKAAEDEGVRKHFTDHYGARFGQMESLVKNVWKDLDVKELEGETIEDFIKDGGKKAKLKLQKAIEDAGKSADTRLQELTTQAAEFKVKWESEKERAEKANELLEQKQKEFDGYKTTLELDKVVAQSFKEVEFIPDITDLQRRGLNDEIKERFEFRLGDGTGEVWDRKTGKPAMNEAGNDAVKIPDAIRLVADPHGLLRKNNMRAGTYVPQQKMSPPANGSPEPRRGKGQ